MKTNTTKKNPKFIVNLIDVETPEEIYDAFFTAKVKAGEPLTLAEYNCEKNIVLTTVLNAIDNAVAEYNTHVHYIQDDKLAQKLMKEVKKYMNKKQPWYKRFWRWITFRKNK